MAKVKDVMTVNVPRVDSSATVLEAVRVMNRASSSGVIVFDGDKAVGIVTDRRLQREFIERNEKPENVKISEVMGPFYKIDPEASLKEAARRILQYNITRLGVFDQDKFLGWITLSDLAKQFSKKSLLEIVRKSNDPHPSQFLCPNCHKAFMDIIDNSQGVILRWQCPRCKYFL